MGPADLRRYRSLLLKKLRELSSAQGEVHSGVPAARSLQGDMIDQANAGDERIALRIVVQHNASDFRCCLCCRIAADFHRLYARLC